MREVIESFERGKAARKAAEINDQIKKLEEFEAEVEKSFKGEEFT